MLVRNAPRLYSIMDIVYILYLRLLLLLFFFCFSIAITTLLTHDYLNSLVSEYSYNICGMIFILDFHCIKSYKICTVDYCYDNSYNCLIHPKYNIQYCLLCNNIARKKFEIKRNSILSYWILKYLFVKIVRVSRLVKIWNLW